MLLLLPTFDLRAICRHTCRRPAGARRLNAMASAYARGSPFVLRHVHSFLPQRHARIDAVRRARHSILLAVAPATAAGFHELLLAVRSIAIDGRIVGRVARTIGIGAWGRGGCRFCWWIGRIARRSVCNAGLRDPRRSGSRSADARARCASRRSARPGSRAF